MRHTSGEPTPDAVEVAEVRFVPLDTAHKEASYASEKKVLKAAAESSPGGRSPVRSPEGARLDTVFAALIGFASGVASGAVGIGGAILSTPGIRWALDVPAVIAVGTTLPVIVPAAITGVIAYIRTGFVETRAAVVAAAAGSCFAVLGALVTDLVQGELLLIATAALILVLAYRMLPRAGDDTSRMSRASSRRSPSCSSSARCPDSSPDSSASAAA